MEISSTQSSPAAPARARTGSLLVIFLTVFIDLLGFGMVLPLLPVYARHFSVSADGLEIAALMSVFSLMQFLFAPLWGRLSDRIGRRPVLMVGLAGSVGFYALFGIASQWESLLVLFIARIGAGIAGATIPVAQAYIADTTTVETRAKGMALIGAAFGLGFTLGPLLAWAAMTVSTSEHAIATSPWPGYVAAALSAVSLLLAIVLLPESLTVASPHSHHSFFDTRALGDALTTPTIPALLVTSFISVVSFGSFETTLSLLLEADFGFTLNQVPLYFAFIGLVLTFAQGFLVRRLSGKVPEMVMAGCGAVVTIVGFSLLIAAVSGEVKSLGLLMAASAVEVTGFALMTPSLQSLISRRSDPARQGGILGISQGTSAIARIVGPLIAIPLLFQYKPAPYYAAMALMALGLVCLLLGARGGKDYGTPTEAVPLEL
jgi:DHA1 family tetracycline resistance protein-like MFS transporter